MSLYGKTGNSSRTAWSDLPILPIKSDDSEDSDRDTNAIDRNEQKPVSPEKPKLKFLPQVQRPVKPLHRHPTHTPLYTLPQKPQKTPKPLELQKSLPKLSPEAQPKAKSSDAGASAPYEKPPDVRDMYDPEVPNDYTQHCKEKEAKALRARMEQSAEISREIMKRQAPEVITELSGEDAYKRRQQLSRR